MIISDGKLEVSANVNFLEIETPINYSDPCGICEKEGAEIFWFSHYSRGAHTECFRKIISLEKCLIHTIEKLFKNPGTQRKAHIRAMQVIKLDCGTDTILSYFEKKGKDALIQLINDVGIQTVKNYAKVSDR